MRIVSATTLALAVLLVAGAPTIVQAKPARTQPDPQVFDYTDPKDLAKLKAKPLEQQDCYIEPEGFHKQIRWDDECVKARKQRERQISRD